MATELTVGVFGQTTVIAVVGGLAVTIVLILLVVICVCGQKQKPKNQDSTEENQKSENADLLSNGKVDSNVVNIDVDTGITPLTNGQVIYDNNVGGNLKVSPGSPHQASHRKLPAPPPDGASAPVLNLSAKLENDEYDHLNRSSRKQSSKDRHSNYDHVTVDSDGLFQIVEGKVLVPDGYYAEVKTENIYAGVKEDENDPDNDDYARVKDGVPKSKEEVTAPVQNGTFIGTIVDDTYSSVKDESKEASQGSRKDFDPYAKVKDDPYAKVKDKDFSQGSIKDNEPYDPYNKVGDDFDSEKSFDPYNKVKDDPYSKVKGDDPYNKVKGDDPYNKVKGDYDPYNKVKGDDDPYNKVNGDDLEQDDLTVGEIALGGIEDHYSKVDPNRKAQNNVTRIDINTSDIGANNLLTPELNACDTNNEYAVVVKNLNDRGGASAGFSVITGNLNKGGNFLGATNEESDPYTLPPEPPRRYGSEEIRGITLETGTSPPTPSPRNSREIQASAESTVNQVAIETTQTESVLEPTKKKEPPYSKLTARESMASINARRALNTYETVAETENFYATVEGGSGDGVITPQVAAASASSQKRSSHINEDYAEIGATGRVSGTVPAPPSLDSLHSMTKQNADGLRLSQNEDDLIDERYASVDHPKSPGSLSNPRLSANVTGARVNVTSDINNQSVLSSLVVHPPLGASGGTDIVLSPNYQTVKDYIPDDGDMDPNYESVEEAKSKIGYDSQEMKDAMMDRKKRTHVYEEVKPSPESTQVKTRVLRSHMYEDIDAVKEQKKEIKRKSKDEDVWKRRSDIEKE